MSSRFVSVGKAVLFSLTLGVAALAQAADGEQVFLSHCAACHGMDGEGTLGVAPPLQNAALWQSLGKQAPSYIAGVVTSGLSGDITVEGKTYKLVMPPQTHLSAEELAAAASYVLQALNGSSERVGVEQVERLKAAPMTHPALLALRVGETLISQVTK